MLADISTHLTFHLWPTFPFFFRQKPEGFESSSSSSSPSTSKLVIVNSPQFSSSVESPQLSVKSQTSSISTQACQSFQMWTQMYLFFLKFVYICLHLWRVQFKWYNDSVACTWLAPQWNCSFRHSAIGNGRPQLSRFTWAWVWSSIYSWSYRSTIFCWLEILWSNTGTKSYCELGNVRGIFSEVFSFI